MLKFKAYCQVCCEYVSVYDGFFQYKDGVYYQCPNHTVMTHTQLMQFTGLYEKNGIFYSNKETIDCGREVYSGDVYIAEDGTEFSIVNCHWKGVCLENGSGYRIRLADSYEKLTFLRGKYESKM